MRPALREENVVVGDGAQSLRAAVEVGGAVKDGVELVFPFVDDRRRLITRLGTAAGEGGSLQTMCKLGGAEFCVHVAGKRQVRLS